MTEADLRAGEELWGKIEEKEERVVRNLKMLFCWL